MVLALQFYKKLEREEEERRRERKDHERDLREEGAAREEALWREAIRLSQGSGENPEEIYERLKAVEERGPSEPSEPQVASPAP